MIFLVYKKNSRIITNSKINIKTLKKYLSLFLKILYYKYKDSRGKNEKRI